MSNGADFTPVFKGYTGQQPFRFWCQTVLPLVYDDSLSYYELLNKVVYYLNNVIADVANVEDNAQSLLTAYNQLQDYVNHYFDNLDVATEINNKLDSMVADGSFAIIVNPLISASVTDWLTNHVDPVGSAVMVDNSLSITGAAADAKVTGDKINLCFSPATAELITDQNYSTVLPDANNAENNRSYFIGSSVTSEMTQHLPVYERRGVLLNFNGMKNSNHGFMQFYVTESAIYFRQESGIGSTYLFTDWIKLGNDADIARLDADIARLDADIDLCFSPATAELITDQNYSTVLPDANNAENNRSYFVGSSVTSEMTQHLPVYERRGVLLNFNGMKNSNHGFMQFYVTQFAIYFRQESGAGSTYLFTDWIKLGNDADISRVENICYAPYSAQMVNTTNYSSMLPDANGATNSKTYFIQSAITDEMVLNLPIYGQTGMLINFNGLRNSRHGFMQWYVTKDNMWYRYETGSGDTQIFSDWVQIITTTELNKWCYMPFATGSVTSSNYTDMLTDANDAVNNKVYFIASNITSAMVANLPVYGVYGELINVQGQKNGRHGFIQLYVTSKSMYFRTETGSGATKIFTTWHRLTNYSDTNTHTARIFKKVVCCGDSYTAGYLVNPSNQAQHITDPAYSWVNYIGKSTGNDWINCGVSGATCLTWQTNENGLAKATAQGNTQAYVVGLMINDSKFTDDSHTARTVPLGTISDIGTQAQTYYGGMSQIIESLHTASSGANIFVNTCPKADAERYDPYNNAVRDIVNYYQTNTNYPVHLIDLAAQPEMFTNPSFTGDYIAYHYSAIGYEQIAEIYEKILSDYINTHISAFQNVHLIPTT